MKRCVLAAVLAMAGAPAMADISASQIEAALRAVEPQVIAWRRDFHQHPELSNRETRTAGIVAAELKALGLEVKEGIGLTGVAAVLRGARPGPTIAIRADMDGLPVTEGVDLPYKSTATAQYRGETVGVMHACGHDAHVAMLLGVAKVLAERKKDLRGQVLFIFQPAEEGPPEGEAGGATRMLKEGLFDIAKPEAVFGLHVMASLPTGTIGYRAGPMMAGADSFKIEVVGRQTHGSRPWGGVDPIVTAAQIITGLQNIVSRQVDITAIPTVISVGAIKGGIRSNILPESVEMIGTIRTFDPAVRRDVIERMKRTASSIAAANDARATMTLENEPSPPVVNNMALAERVKPSLERAVGKDKVQNITLQTTAEDFAFYGLQVPAHFFWVGVTPAGTDPASAAFNHSPLFNLDEAGMAVGMRAMLQVATDYLQGK